MAKVPVVGLTMVTIPPLVKLALTLFPNDGVVAFVAVPFVAVVVLVAVALVADPLAEGHGWLNG